MAKPPPDADPELFILGRGGYDNLRIARPWHDDTVFRIDPAPMPVISIIVFNLILTAVIGGFFWLVISRPSGALHAGWLGAIIGIGVFICVSFTSLVYWRFHSERRAGPWLIYHKASGLVNLPRHGISFAPHEIVHVQYITTKDLAWSGVVNNEQYSELNLVTCVDGERKRWPMLRSIFNVRAFDYIVRPLVEQTRLPVVRVKDQLWGWKVTAQPYRKPEPKLHGS